MAKGGDLYMESRLTGLDWIKSTQDIYNSIPNGSNYSIDPCEINIELVRKKCENWTGEECTLGVVMKEGIAYCPLQEQKQITLRNNFGSIEAPIQDIA